MRGSVILIHGKDSTMENKNIGCKELAESIKAIMTIANFSGYIEQEEGEPFRQYEVSSVTGSKDNAAILLGFAGHRFKIDIFYDPTHAGEVKNNND